MVSDLGVFVYLSSALLQLPDGVGFLSIVEASSVDPVFSYVVYYRSDEVPWSVGDLCSPLMLDDFAPGNVHPLLQEVAYGRKHASGHCSCDQPLGLVPVCYCKGAALTLEEVALFVRDLFGRSGSGGSSDVPTSPRGPLVDVDDWVLGDIFTSGSPDPCSASKADFDRLCGA